MRTWRFRQALVLDWPALAIFRSVSSVCPRINLFSYYSWGPIWKYIQITMYPNLWKKLRCCLGVPCKSCEQSCKFVSQFLPWIQKDCNFPNEENNPWGWPTNILDMKLIGVFEFKAKLHHSSSRRTIHYTSPPVPSHHQNQGHDEDLRKPAAELNI